MSAMARWIGLALLTTALVGCGKSGDAPTTQKDQATEQKPATTTSTDSAKSHATAGSSASSSPTEGPDAIVNQFLTALRKGDKETVAGLLTTVAREETIRLGYEINPPGDPSSKHEVGRVEYPDAEGKEALVSSVWTHDLAEGETFSFEVVWMMKREDAGWRVGGFAVTDPQSQQPLVFNFENLQQVFETKEQVEQTAASPEEPQARQAQNPPADAAQPPAQ